MDQMWDTGLSCEAQPFQSADPPVRMELEGSVSTERIPAPAEAVPAESDAAPVSTGAASQLNRGCSGDKAVSAETP